MVVGKAARSCKDRAGGLQAREKFLWPANAGESEDSLACKFRRLGIRHKARGQDRTTPGNHTPDAGAIFADQHDRMRTGERGRESFAQGARRKDLAVAK